MKKAIVPTDGELRQSTREKNLISRYGYDEYMVYHYAFMMKVASVREPATLFEAIKDPHGSMR